MRRFFVALLVFALLYMPQAFAAGEPVDVRGPFAALPVLHEGRIKPMDRFAEVELNRLSRGDTDMTPLAWLAESLFNPQRAARRAVIKIDNAALRARLDLPERENALYSLEELSSRLRRTQSQVVQLMTSTQEDLTAEQSALLSLHENALQYGQILQAMSLFLPLDLKVPDSLTFEKKNGDDRITYLDLRRKETEIMARVRALTRDKGENPESYNEKERALATLAYELTMLGRAGESNTLFRVIPSSRQTEQNWISPWSVVTQEQGAPQSWKLLEKWQDMALAYQQGDTARFQKAAQNLHERVLSQSEGQNIVRRIKAEQLYDTLDPFKLTVLLYILGLFSCLACFVKPLAVFQRSSVFLVVAGTLTHLSGMVLRIIILERPPVGSLYESLLFVALVVVLAGLVVEGMRRDSLALAGGVSAATILLLIAPAVAPPGDDLEMLVAVLNTNFWLATHVICITAGYGFCILASVLAHLYLFLRGRYQGEAREGLFRNVYILSLAALFLTAFGTVLGGIWADQSWGRFWGWDPKENGALLIVLWLIWLLHGRHSGHFARTGFAAGLALLNIIVALAWFGVNLLGVGLHSYGFTSGLAAGLASFIAGELILTAILYTYAVKIAARQPER